MHMNNDKNDEIEICQNFDFYFHVGETPRVCSERVSMDGENPLCMYLHSNIILWYRLLN